MKVKKVIVVVAIQYWFMEEFIFLGSKKGLPQGKLGKICFVLKLLVGITHVFIRNIKNQSHG